MSAHQGVYTAEGGHGSSAFGNDVRRFINLTFTLAATEFKLRYFGSALGYLWSLMRPLMLFGVLYVMIIKILKAGGTTPHFGVYLLTSIILWMFFVEATTNCVQCLLAREGLLRKMRFPRLVIPLSVALTALFNLGTNFVAILVFALASGVDPRWSWLEMPIFVVLLATLAVGTGMLLSVLYVRFRDIQPIWEVITQMLFYGSPIMYVATQYEHFSHLAVRIAMCSPIAAILTQMGHAFVVSSLHSTSTYIGGSIRLLIPVGIIAVVFGVGLWFFSREAPRIAENI